MKEDFTNSLDLAVPEVVIAVGFLSVRYPVRYLGKRLLRSGQAS